MRVAMTAAILTALASAQVPDPAFTRVPFSQWTEEGQAHLRWRPQIGAGGLTNHQRWMYRIDVRLDGAEVVKRRGKGELLMLVEFKDSEGRAFQTHGSFPLETVKDEASGSDLQYAQDVFLTPGEYHIALAVYASTTGEYALARRTLRVDPVARDPLPEAWRDLPPVEFIHAGDPPDAWFLPGTRGRLHLPVETRRPVAIDVLMNATPSEEVSRRPRPSAMSVLIPSLKTLAQMTPEKGLMSFTLFDLARQKIMFQSPSGLHWRDLRIALAETTQPMIDVRALEKRHSSAQFFVKDVARRVEDSQGAEAMRILIVLSAPMAFDSGEDLTPIATSAGKNCKVFYIRYAAVGPRFIMPPPNAPGRGMTNFPRSTGPLPSDSLAKTLKPLNPRLFDVTTPLEFRKALAAIIAEIEESAG